VFLGVVVVYSIYVVSVLVLSSAKGNTVGRKAVNVKHRLRTEVKMQTKGKMQSAEF